MKKIMLIVIAVLLVTPLVTSCSLFAPSVDEAKADFCADLGELGEAVVNVRQINEGSTVQELQDANKAVQDAWDNLKSSAQTMKSVKINGIQQSVGTLGKTVGDISDDATLTEAQLSIKQDILATVEEVLETMQTTCTYPQE